MIKNKIVYNEFSDWRFNISKADGSYLWDGEGRKLIDFTSGWNVANLGWNHPEVNEALVKQARKNVYAPMWTADPIQEEYAQSLIESLPKELNAVCRGTGGTEANEMALKIARSATGRKKIIGFRDTYHGQSFGAMAIGYRPEYVKAIAPLVPEFIQLTYPSSFALRRSEKETLAEFLTQLEDFLKKRDIAAIVSEAGIITGWGSTLVAPKGYLPAIRKLTKQYGTLLILDEVGTGFSRCGKLFGMELEGVVPDIATFAKGMCNGAAAIGATVVKSDIVSPTILNTNLTSTFGWTPVACAAALAALKIHKREKFWDKAKRDGEFLLIRLKQLLSEHEKVGEVQGVGMEIGVMFVRDKKSLEPNNEFAKKVVNLSFQRGLHMVFGGDGNIQIMPPLTTPKGVLEEGIDIFIKAVKTLHE